MDKETIIYILIGIGFYLFRTIQRSKQKKSNKVRELEEEPLQANNMEEEAATDDAGYMETVQDVEEEQVMLTKENVEEMVQQLFKEEAEKEKKKEVIDEKKPIILKKDKYRRSDKEKTAADSSMQDNEYSLPDELEQDIDIDIEEAVIYSEILNRKYR